MAIVHTCKLHAHNYIRKILGGGTPDPIGHLVHIHFGNELNYKDHLKIYIFV